ncbi:MAG: aminomethyl-transferring glycine dehydrogenase subunit GcvPA [Thermoleophilia bacterium]
MAREPFIHPYIPNSVPATRAAMLREIGISDVEEIFAEIPDRLRFKGTLNIPPAILAERDLERHVKALLDKNTSSEEFLNFCGAGCWQHYVPAVVDEVINRAEFLSAYCGGNYSDLGKYQARFEFNSQLGELLDLDGVANPIYDWGDVAGRSFRMATRITGRKRVLYPRTMSPMRLAEVRTLSQPEVLPTHVKLESVDYDPASGNIDLVDLKAKLGDDVAAVYFENPGYLGNIEAQAGEIVRLAHDAGALAIIGVDPITLGVLTSPGSIGADIACGDIQPLGMHMHAGGGCSGFIAFRDDDPIFASECPLELYTLLETEVPGQYAVAETMAERTSYGARDQGKDWVGTASGLWTIAAAVYMTVMGPQGFKEIGETCIARSHYAAQRLAAISGVTIKLSPAFVKEFVVNFDGGGKTVAAINKALLEKGIFGGKDLSAEFPELGQSALYCVTEYYSQADIDYLAFALKEVMA